MTGGTDEIGATPRRLLIDGGLLDGMLTPLEVQYPEPDLTTP
ncbi:hypothetical protein [Actinophytocola sp. NPDC049390]